MNLNPKDPPNNKENLAESRLKSLGISVKPFSSKLHSSRAVRPSFPAPAHKPSPRSKEYRSFTTRHSENRFFPTQELPNAEPPKSSVKENGVVKAYAASTNQGLVRNYNEDRVSIILNIIKPAHRAAENWPRCSFFGVYDGHGGAACSDFLRDNLHQFVIRSAAFPFAPKEALRDGFEATERAFLELASSMCPVNKSGSCGVVVLIVGDVCYVANVGDSRAVMSGDKGTKIYPLSRDHKPSDEKEYERIVNSGGKVYQSAAQVQSDQKVLGPYRVFPGRLSVSRSFGDIEAKLPAYGGNKHVLIAEPEIKAFKIHANYDFIVVASDGIFDKMSNREVVQQVWGLMIEAPAENTHKLCEKGVVGVMKNALARRTLDNVTVVMIAFENLV